MEDETHTHLKTSLIAVAFSIFLFLVPLSAMASDQTVELTAGFNFIGILINTDFSSNRFFESSSDIKSVFRFDPVKQSFDYQIKLANGSLFGSAFALSSSRGIVVQCTAPTSVTLTDNGGATVTDPLPFFNSGFNFVALPRLVGSSSRDFLVTHSEVRSIFQWIPDKSSFSFVLKLANGSVFGEDFVFGPASKAYFVNASGPIAPTRVLQALAIIPGNHSVIAGANLDIGTIRVYALYDDQTTEEITASTLATVKSGGGAIAGRAFTAPMTPGPNVLTLSYTEGGVTRTVDATVDVIAATVVSIALSTTEITLFTGLTTDLATVGTIATYDNGKTSSVLANWSITSGGGTLTGKVYTAPTTAGSSIAKATYVAGTTSYTANLTIRFSVAKLLSLVLSTSQVTIPTGGTYAMSGLSPYATYEDGTTQSVAVTWSQISGSGNIASGSFIAPGTPGNTVLRATYTEAGITKTADVTVRINSAVYTSLSLTTSEIYMPAGSSVSLASIVSGSAVYEGGMTAPVTLTWSVISGGSLTGSTWAAPLTTGTATLSVPHPAPWTQVCRSSGSLPWTFDPS